MPMNQLLPYCLLIFWIGIAGKASTQSILESTPLPIIVINTLGSPIFDSPRIRARMGIIDQPNSGLNSPNDSFTDYDGWISIEIRGSSSQMFPKKGYGLETQQADSSNHNVALLGMPKENDWILHGPFSDKSLIRNRLTFELANKLPYYAPRTRFIELMINDEYQGLYLLMEKIKRDKNRVDIAKLEPTDTEPEAITGGYLLKLDKSNGNGGEGWITPGQTFIQYEYPKSADIIPQQEAYIQEYVNAFEAALFSIHYQDPTEGFRAYINEDSFIDYILINELSKNVDAYRLSTFLYKDRGQKLHAGPIWDYNLAYGNANYCAGAPTSGWVLNFNENCPRDAWIINNWWDRLLMDPDFGASLIDRWTSLRQGPWHTDSILQIIDTEIAALDEAPTRNFQQWNILREWIWPNAVVMGDYPTEIFYLRNWLRNRLEWIDAHIVTISSEVVGIDSRESTRIFPNPFAQTLTLNFRNTRAGTYSVQFFDLQGRPVRQLNYSEQDGYESFYTWDGRDALGRSIPAGIYLYQISHNGSLIHQGKLIRNN